MKILADTHIHIYPVHDAAALISGAGRLLGREVSAPPAVRVLFLAEGRGHNFFNRLRDGTHGLPAPFRVEAAGEAGAARVAWSEGEEIWIVAGRQVVSAERVEILALLTAGAEGVEDGLPAAAVVEAVLAAGGVPVLAWAPGKWMFKRGAVVRSLLRNFGPESLLLGDTSLRSLGWPEPAVMREPGRRVLAGSDPLPFAGEEARAGSYGVVLAGEFDERLPVTALRRLLLDPATPIRRLGRRDPPWRTVFRLVRHQLRKAKAR